MSGDDLIAQFERGNTPASSFHHADHVRLAFEYLCRYPVLESLAKFSAALRRFAESHGKPGLYHETITWAYLFAIHERMLRVETLQSWEEFAAANPDLLRWERGTGGLLARYYASSTLGSDAARRSFLMPDKLSAS